MNAKRKRKAPATATPSAQSQQKTAPKPRRGRGATVQRNGLQNITNKNSENCLEVEEDASIDISSSSSDDEQPLRGRQRITDDDAAASSSSSHADETPAASIRESPQSVFKKPNCSKMITAKKQNITSGSDIPASVSPTKRKRHNGLDDTDKDLVELGTEISLFDSVKQVLQKHYFDVVTRLQLDFQPFCLGNLEYCAKFHSKNGDQPHEIDIYAIKDARSLITEDRPHEFLKIVAKMSISNDFPGKIVILTLLELILTVNKPAHDHYTTSFIIETAHYLFENIVYNFPPCWSDVRDSYKKLLHQKLQVDLPSNKYDQNDGIVKVVLNMLENVLQEEGESIPNFLPNNSCSDFESPVDFYTWDMRNQQKYLFDKLRRDDKIERIFLVLHLLVKLMESDLAIWIIRHPKHTSITMSKPKKMPLIGYLLWPAEACGQINGIVKKILNLFIISISIGIPPEKIDILARFVNLVANAVNLCELQPKNGEIIFPNIQSHTEIFALEIKKTIEKIQTCNVDLFLAVIDHIKAPFIKIIAIDDLLRKFNSSDKGKPSMKKLYQNFVKKRWTECDDEGARKVFLYIPDEASLSMYPVHNPNAQKRKQKQADIFQKDYLDLLMAAFKAYQLLYQVDEIIRINNKESSSMAGGSSNDQMMHDAEYEDKLQRIQKIKDNKFDFDKMEKDINKLVKMGTRSARMDLVHHKKVDLDMNEIVVNATTVTNYRDDMKHYLMLEQLILKYRDEYGDIFNDWVRAIKIDK